MKQGHFLKKLTITLSVFLWTQAPIPAHSKTPWEKMQNNLDELNSEYEAKKKALHALEKNFEQANRDFLSEKINYLRIKSASRDWNRRNNAEEDFFKAYEAYQNAKFAFHTEKQDVRMLLSQIESSKAFQTLAKRSVASKKEPFGFELFGSKNSWLTMGILLNALWLSFIFIFSDVLKSFIAWLILKRKKYCRVQDHIEILGISGEITHIGFFKTTLKESRGDPHLTPFTSGAQQLHYLPNHLILKHPLRHYRREEKIESKIAA